MRSSLLLLALVVAVPALTAGQGARRALSTADVDDIATLLRLEDTRQFDDAALGRVLRASHPELRRRAAIAIGRIADPRGRALLEQARGDANLDVAAAVVFGLGQLKDAAAVPVLAELLAAPLTPPAVAREAARGLGKIRTPESRAALARYLTTAPPTPVTAAVVGEALLSIGRFPDRGDLAPVLRWVDSNNVELAWRATWALFRPRDPAAVPHLLKLSDHASADVRFWAVRGLAAPAPVAQPGRGAAGAAPPPAPAPAPLVEPARLAERLRAAVGDPDRRVRTEALRALVTYDDDASFAIVLEALESTDVWMSTSAAEALSRYGARASVVVPRLVAALAPDRPLALRITALTPLVAMAPDAAIEPAVALAVDKSAVARMAGRQALPRAGAAGRARLDALPADPGAPAAAGRGAAGGGRGAAPAPVARPETEYRALVDRWIVPDYNGAPKPRLLVETPRGAIEIELFAGDAPFGLEHLVTLVQSRDIVGTEFGRLVPNFVAQQRTIRNAARLRDEVNQRGLTRGNLSWASSGLDTGRPGYTLGHTPQPHNEGDFTSLGRVIRGLDVMDRLELGDAILAARIQPGR